MRVSLWKQERKGARWYRFGVVIFDRGGEMPFKRTVRHGAGNLPKSWPRICWYELEREYYGDLTDTRRY
jgi:hypothetical protein